MKVIPYGRQHIDKSDIDEVVKVLKSDWVTQGPKIKEFEDALAKYCGTKYAVAVSSGTAALHLACLVCGLKKGDEAITTPITFLATANSILYTGAKPVFADIDYETINIDPQQIKRKITRRTKAILPVHFAGLSCNMPEISKIARENKLVVIEDACHALGAEYKCKGKWVKVGGCRHSDMAVFSFHPVKTITTGEGGAITTNNRELYKKLRALRSHGIYKDKKTAKKGLWYYEMRTLGSNYRITDFQCALGLSQLKKIDSFIKRRRKIAALYDKAFTAIEGIETQYINDGKRHAYHLYLLKIDFRKLNTSRQKFVVNLKNQGILSQVHYIPLYHQPYYRKRYSFDLDDFQGSELYYKKALSIPIYPMMSNRDVDNVINAVKKSLTRIIR